MYDLFPAHTLISTCLCFPAVLIHCGAGVSRSASLCIAFLMRDRRITAHEALQLVKERRSIAEPNDGFWRMLCALEAPLGLQQRYCNCPLYL